MKERLTHSKRSSFLFCPRQYFLRYERKLELAVQRQGRRRGTVFGNAVQAARDCAQVAFDHGAELHPMAPFEAAMNAVDEFYDNAGELAPSQDDMDTIEVERSKLRVMVRLYVERYGLTARREVEYELPYRNPATGGYSKTFRIAGKIDGLEVVGPKRGRIVEDKFVAQIQQAMIDKLPLDSQTTEYVHALLSKGWSAEVAYRHTRYPGINPKKEKVLKTRTDPAETLDAFEIRLSEDVAERPEFYFDEQVLMFPMARLAEFEQERWETGQHIIHARSRLPVVGQAAFPMSPTRCWEYGGCNFIPICTGRAGALDMYRTVDSEIELSERQEATE